MNSIKYILYFALTLILFSSCSLFSDGDGYEGALAKWSQNKVSNYEFNYDVECFCPRVTPAIVVVNQDTVYQILDPVTRDSLFFQTGESTFQYAGDLFPTFYHTIDGLFEIVKEARIEAYKINVTFNDGMGFPESISIDYIKNAVDDEIGYSISNYRKTSLKVEN